MQGMSGKKARTILACWQFLQVLKNKLRCSAATFLVCNPKFCCANYPPNLSLRFLSKKPKCSVFLCKFCSMNNCWSFVEKMYVESKTRKHHGRVGSGSTQRSGWARRVQQDGPTGFSAQDTTVTCVLQGIEDNCLEHHFGSTNKRNPM